ncbi:hypothetical protein [Prosthecobacter sp.]|uniref:hypothetical protein n=1 Tax=Prosthecobacter sp. TaxID=1965333 RepID=UPI00378393AC
MKRIILLSTSIALASCASFINTHRMHAAQTKLQAARKLQQGGQWDAALEMAERMHSSVAKSIETAPTHKGPGGILVDIRPLLTGWETGPFASLKSALQKHDSHSATSAFASLRQQCMNCHAVIGKADIKLQEIP